MSIVIHAHSMKLKLTKEAVTPIVGAVVPSTLARLIRGQSAISPEMVLRLSVALGRSPERWLAMQHNYDLWQARQRVDLRKVKRFDVDAA